MKEKYKVGHQVGVGNKLLSYGTMMGNGLMER
jgi:hypothetical protein